MSTTATGATTVLDALEDALRAASAFNKHDQGPPAAVLWPDNDRQWELILNRLRDRLPIFVLGPYAPQQATGPAYWLRCVIARALPDAVFPDDEVPIIYVPGYSRQDIRAVETCPPELQPLAELQYRGVIWAQKNARDWTIAAFLQSKDGGLGIEVAGDAATRDALVRAMPTIIEEPIGSVRREAPIRAPYLNGLLHPDHVKDVLRWLDDPSAFRASSTAEEWAGFVDLCQDRYEFHPEHDGPITAARLLGLRDGSWRTVWQRFAEAPGVYRAVPETLRKARPEKLLPLLDSQESWPQENEGAEAALREALLGLASLDAEAARKAIIDLEGEHRHRRDWVWSALGRAPLANALGHLANMAKGTSQALTGSSIEGVASAYADTGWRVDRAVLDSLAAVEAAEDLAAVIVPLQVIYRPWLEAGAVCLQGVVGTGTYGYVATPPPPVEQGTCVLFTDGLRFDAAMRVMDLLEVDGFECTLESGLAALPSITATAKPAVSPAASLLKGEDVVGLAPVLADSGAKVTAEVLRRALSSSGLQVLRGDELGDPTGSAWTELGDIDSYGHEHGWRVAHHLDAELRGIARRIGGLLGHGWRQVIVVTDHGWLLLPGGLPKRNLPEHLTEVRKGRCARLKEGSKTDEQIVPWHWDPSVRFAVAPGIDCYEAGKQYEHGGLSPQECVVPRLMVSGRASADPAATIESVTWRRLRCDVVVKGASAGLRVDVRTRAGDPNTSLVHGGKAVEPDGTAALLVDDEDREGEGAAVVLVAADGNLKSQAATLIGGQD